MSPSLPIVSPRLTPSADARDGNAPCASHTSWCSKSPYICSFFSQQLSSQQSRTIALDAICTSTCSTSAQLCTSSFPWSANGSFRPLSSFALFRLSHHVQKKLRPAFRYLCTLLSVHLISTPCASSFVMQDPLRLLYHHCLVSGYLQLCL